MHLGPSFTFTPFTPYNTDTHFQLLSQSCLESNSTPEYRTVLYQVYSVLHAVAHQSGGWWYNSNTWQEVKVKLWARNTGKAELHSPKRKPYSPECKGLTEQQWWGPDIILTYVPDHTIYMRGGAARTEGGYFPLVPAAASYQSGWEKAPKY